MNTRAVTMLVTATAACAAFADPVRLITLDPGHFHAGLVQKSMVAGVDPVVHVMLPPDRNWTAIWLSIDGFNHWSAQPTHWETKVHASPGDLEAMLREHPGNVVVIAVNNAKKSQYILECVKAGLNVLADKPMAITPEGFALIEEAYRVAAEDIRPAGHHDRAP